MSLHYERHVVWNWRQKKLEAIRKHQGKSLWLAFDIEGKPVTYEGYIACSEECDYKNAHSFIIAQLLETDSISEFAGMIGYDGQEKRLLSTFVEKDRCGDYWQQLAHDWFDAEWMGEKL